MKSQTLLRLYMFWENRIVQFGKPDGPIFMTSTSCLIFFHLGPLMPFSPFFLPQNTLDHQIFNFNSFLIYVPKLQKPDSPE
jgi:hypothetical protein